MTISNVWGSIDNPCFQNFKPSPPPPPLQYTYTGIALNELHGLQLHCTSSQLVNGVCPITTGQQTIDKLGLDYITITQSAFVLVAYIVLSRIGAYIALRYIKH